MNPGLQPGAAVSVRRQHLAVPGQQTHFTLFDLESSSSLGPTFLWPNKPGHWVKQCLLNVKSSQPHEEENSKEKGGIIHVKYPPARSHTRTHTHEHTHTSKLQQ